MRSQLFSAYLVKRIEVLRALGQLGGDFRAPWLRDLSSSTQSGDQADSLGFLAVQRFAEQQVSIWPWPCRRE